MAEISSGSFLMGNESHDAFLGDGEGPIREVFVQSFLLDVATVTNSQFEEFVNSTGYTTDAENFGWSFVFAGLIDQRDMESVIDGTVVDAPWWLGVRGATWKHPFGPHTGIADLGDHPVVHVSWNDAAEYAKWAGKRLATEAEWEKACRGGLTQKRFPWGDDLEPDGIHKMNVWQGQFPNENIGADGYFATAPACSFEPNKFGLYNMTGNVWEWTADFFSATWHKPENDSTRINPAGPDTGSERVLRGGSYMCHVSYCNRYRTSGRTHNTADTSTGHIGFRCAADIADTRA